MKRLSLQDLQNIEFGILVEFANFCDEHGLRYYLCGGTLIGAIRHKGFIPWDDDIDVMMPRPDFQKFLELHRKDGMLSSYHKLDHISLDTEALGATLRIYDKRTVLEFTDANYKHDFGCWIDIFPLDGLSSFSQLRWLHFFCARIVQVLSILNDTKMGSNRRNKLYNLLQYCFIIILPIVRMVGHRKWARLMDAISKLWSYESSEYVGVLDGRAREKEAMRKSNTEPAVKVEFCGKEFYAMANYDEYLTNLYRDYMTPPSEENRKSRHEIDVYWRDNV